MGALYRATIGLIIYTNLGITRAVVNLQSESFEAWPECATLVLRIPVI